MSRKIIRRLVDMVFSLSAACWCCQLCEYPALFPERSILHQQICEVGRLRRLLRGGFPRFEQVGNPFLELPNLRPDFPDKAVCLLNTAVQFAFLGGDTFLLHLASRHAHVDGGYLVYAALGVAAVVDTLRASVPSKKSLQ